MVQTLDPTSDITIGGGWSIVGGAGSAWASLSDANDATYVEGGNTVGSGEYVEVTLDPADAPGASGLHRIHVRATRRNPSLLNVLLGVELVQGTTVIATRQQTLPVPGTPFTNYQWDLTTGEAGAITDYADLRVRLVDNQSQGTARQLVTKTYVELDDPPAAIADFSGTPLAGVKPLTVVFTNLSDTAGGDGILPDWTFSWSFGDSGTSTDVHPTHTYTAAGTYTVSLTVTAPGGNDTETKVGYVVVSDVFVPGDRNALQAGHRTHRIQAEGVAP